MKRILIAEDDPVSHKLLSRTVQKLGFDPISAKDGDDACRILSQPDSPRMAVLDWMMPGMSGPEVCRRVRETAHENEDHRYTYLLLLTAKSKQTDVTEGLRSGADDYLTKPFERTELQCRLDVGERVLALYRALESKIHQYKETMDQLRRMQELLPICMHCNDVRDEDNRWHDLQAFLAQNAGVNFSHSVCENCWTEHYPELPRTSKAVKSDSGT